MNKRLVTMMALLLVFGSVFISVSVASFLENAPSGSSEEDFISLLALWQSTSGNPTDKNNVIHVLKLELMDHFGAHSGNKSYAELNWKRADILWAKGYNSDGTVHDYMDIPLWHIERIASTTVVPAPPGYKNCV